MPKVAAESRNTEDGAGTAIGMGVLIPLGPLAGGEDGMNWNCWEADPTRNKLNPGDAGVGVTAGVGTAGAGGGVTGAGGIHSSV